MKVDVKKLIILNIPYVIVFYMVDKVAWLYRHVNGDLAGMRLVNTFTNFKLAFQNPLPSFHPTDILIGIAGALIMKAVVYYRGKNAKKFRQGVEYGSARWGTPADIKPYVDEKDDNNIILTETECQEQEHSGSRRVRLRKNKVFRQAEYHAASQFLLHHRSKRHTASRMRESSGKGKISDQSAESHQL